ncbi:kinase-like protein [Candidatus Nitrosoglobus terrae]|uniref:Kinase-like protein n=1 Tax=Candidatus Nitrosoglobus terrae TaxID=1630141 RepID=A0A1Q2SNI3_9GAMM|nr:kinase [Candidatus Nitrosoglobus terrae]BAW80663.1 kinase-like protein [Candidatus Nitrosoglobus terrae]
MVAISIYPSISNILHQLGRKERNFNDHTIRYALERLEAATDNFWGTYANIYHKLEQKCQQLQCVYPVFEAKCQQLGITIDPQVIWRVYLPLAEWVVEERKRVLKDVFILGINGAQGSGKSTLCALLQVILETGFSQRAVSVSIDNFYLTRSERQRLAAEVHPLLITRGVPGTHNVVLAISIFKSLKAARPNSSIRLPIFDKALDDQLPEEKELIFQGRPDIVLFEGWCVGARPEPDHQLARSINRLEAEEDPDGVWRYYVNRALGRQYAQLFSLLDKLLLLEIPEFKVAYAQRLEQEQQLARRLLKEGGANSARRIMDTDELKRFIMHFQRLTEYMLDEMSVRADLVLKINADRQFLKARKRILS